MINRYVEVTDEYVKQLEHEIDNLKAINEEHKKINGKLREEYNKIQSLYEGVFAESKKQKELIEKATKIINDYLKEAYSIYTENEIEVELIVELKNILKEVSE